MSFADSIGISHDWGYVVGTLIFLPLLLVLMFFWIRAKAYHPFLYWATIIASTTAGTTMVDYATRSMGIGYPGGSLLLLGAAVGDFFDKPLDKGGLDFSRPLATGILAVAIVALIVFLPKRAGVHREK